MAAFVCRRVAWRARSSCASASARAFEAAASLAAACSALASAIAARASWMRRVASMGGAEEGRIEGEGEGLDEEGVGVAACCVPTG